MGVVSFYTLIFPEYLRNISVKSQTMNIEPELDYNS